jgi:hypothetical protein
MRELGPVRDLETLDGALLFASADPQVVREVVQVLVRGLERDDTQPQPPPKLQSVAKRNRPPEKRDAAVSEATDRWGFRFDDPTGEDR